MRTTTAPYTESRLAHLVRNNCVGFLVVEHIGKFTAGIIDSARNLPPVSLHQCKFAAGINNTSGTGGKFTPGVIDTCSAP